MDEDILCLLIDVKGWLNFLSAVNDPNRKDILPRLDETIIKLEGRQGKSFASIEKI